MYECVAVCDSESFGTIYDAKPVSALYDKESLSILYYTSKSVSTVSDNDLFTCSILYAIKLVSTRFDIGSLSTHYNTGSLSTKITLIHLVLYVTLKQFYSV